MINLGLGDVLLNAETGEIYTPNTNKLFKMGENPQENVNVVDKNNENTPNLVENKPNNEDLTQNDINTLEKEEQAEKGEKKPKKGGVKDESGN
jgi:hypothetical protein